MEKKRFFSCLLFCSSFFLIFFPLSVSALQVTPLLKQATLGPCQQAVFPFKLTGEGQVSLRLSNQLGMLNYSAPTSFYLNNGEEAIVPVTVLYPCDASPSAANPAGLYGFNLVTQQGSREVVGTAHTYVSPASNLYVSLASSELACSCGSGALTLEIRNAGRNRETGTILVSSQFPFSIAGTSFDLQPGGQSVLKQIVVNLDCSVQPGVYPVSVAVASRGSGVKYAYAAVSVAQCYASNLTGPRQAAFCYGGPINLEYSLYNNGNFEQTYYVSTTLGELPFSVINLQAHSLIPFNVSISQVSVPYPGGYNFSLTALRSQGVETIPVSLTTYLCQGQDQMVPAVNVAYPSLAQNNTLAVARGINRLELVVYNPNNFSIHNAALSLVNYGAISNLFELSANETRQIPVVITMPENFTNSTATAALLLESDQGNNRRLIKLENNQQSNRATGLFVLGSYTINEAYLAFGVVALLILAVLFYYYESQRRNELIVDKQVSGYLRAILAKHAGRRH